MHFDKRISVDNSYMLLFKHIHEGFSNQLYSQINMTLYLVLSHFVIVIIKVEQHYSGVHVRMGA